jgi:hypothetical protein
MSVGQKAITPPAPLGQDCTECVSILPPRASDAISICGNSGEISRTM